MSSATTSDEPNSLRKKYGAELPSGLIRFLADYGNRGIYITHVYATSATQSGIGIIMHTGFRETGKRLRKRIGFVLDVWNTDTSILREYKSAYHAWVRQHGLEDNADE